MSKFQRIITFLLLFSGSWIPSYGQLTTIGKEFRFGFMENNRIENFNSPQNSALDYGIVLITASEEAAGIIQYGNEQVNFNLQAGQQFLHRIEDMDILHRFSGQVENKSVYVSSTGNVSVYAFNERSRSADGTVILPISSLGKEYYVVSHFEIMTAFTSYNYSPNVNDESIFLIVAVEDNTQIEITPSAFTLSGNQGGVPFTINLNAGQSYQVKSKADLTGTRIRVVGDNADDCKNIAAFGGNKWTSVGNCGGANDHLFQQLYPLTTWGKDYLHIGLAGRSSGELVKVLAAENNTEVFVDGQSVGIINSGDFLSLDFEPDAIKRIQSDKPSSVTVFAKSQECNQANDPNFGDGDPFMITYSPTEQLLTSVAFNAIQLPVVTAHFVNIIVKTAAVDKTVLDGQNIGNQFAPFPQNPDYSYARIRINEGVHRLRNEDGFIGYVYGFGDVESYGYAVGASLENLNFEVDSSYDFEIEGDRIACIGQEGQWEIFPENEIFTYFLWEFGDGSPLKEGKSVGHIFTEPGEYEVKVIASLSPNSCDQQEEVLFSLTVDEIRGDIRGADAVCPLVEEHTYSFFSEEEFKKVLWEVEGGEILELNENMGSVNVKWGAANPGAFLKAIPYSLAGCPQEPIQLGVDINPIIESKAPEGSTEICFDETMAWEYSVPNPSVSRNYEWFVENGTIQGDKDQKTVMVLWDNPGLTGSVWYSESNKLDEQCAGISPKLDVIVSEIFEISSVNKENVSCFGENNGRIEVIVQGGVVPYSYEWGHDPNLDASIAENLPAGDYSFKVKDAFGCEILSDIIEVTQPEVLAVESLNAFQPSCFGRGDGQALVFVKGGEPPYLIDYEDAEVFDEEIRLDNFHPGVYFFVVSDANGCNVEVNFEIEEPVPDEVNVLLQNAPCPGQEGGELFVEVGTEYPPYLFRWDYNNRNLQVLSDIPRGMYQVEVTDNRGCISIGTGEVKESAPIVRMPTGFKLQDGLFQGVSNCNVNFTLTIFNRWGQTIYSGSEGWDGQIATGTAPTGTYSYVYQYTFELDGQIITKEIRGLFTFLM
jgi:hypothetical protein